jgi:GPH family glycoside/pentoside/hexuronide:cation symporter
MSEDKEIIPSEWEQASTKKMIYYSFGFLLVYFMGGEFNAYVFYYYEVEIGLPVAFLGLAFVIFAVWNMVNDPLVGYLTDRPFRWTKKLGWRFPWILIAIIPYLLCWFLLFAVPENLIDQTDPWPLFWYFVIIACLYDTFYSLYSIHVNAGYTNHFRTDSERRKASAITLGVPRILMVLMGFTVPFFYVYGDRNSMIFAQSLIIFMLIICVLIFIPGIRESEDLKERFLRGYKSSEKVSYFKTMKTAFKQKNFVAALLIFMLLSLAGTLNTASGVYFMKDILRLPLYNAIFIGLATFVGFMVFIPFWSNTVKRIGHVKTMKLSLILIAFVYLPALWMTTLLEAIIYAFLGGFIAGAFWITLGPITADVNDENTITVGKHQEGVLAGIRTFFFRFALIFQAVIFTVVHIATEYNPDPKAIQTPLAAWGIRIHMGLIPSLLTLLAFIIMVKWYDLEGEKKISIKLKLKQMGL